MKISSLQSIKWVWSLSFGGVVWVGFSFVAVVPEAVPEMLEPMPYLRIHLHLLGHYAYMHGTSIYYYIDIVEHQHFTGQHHLKAG